MHYRIAAVAAAMLVAGMAVAQTPATKPAPASFSAGKPAKPPVVRTAKSLDCSKQADAKDLHGKPRKSFMSGCKKA